MTIKQLALTINGSAIPAPGNIPTGGADTGQKILQIGLSLLFTLAVVLAVAFIIYSGIQWTMSGGDKQKIQQARLRLTFAIVGLIVVAASFFIVRIAFTLLGAPLGLFF